jgi:hypothetical protein
MEIDNDSRHVEARLCLAKVFPTRSAASRRTQSLRPRRVRKGAKVFPTRSAAFQKTMNSRPKPAGRVVMLQASISPAMLNAPAKRAARAVNHRTSGDRVTRERRTLSWVIAHEQPAIRCARCKQSSQRGKSHGFLFPETSKQWTICLSKPSGIPSEVNVQATVA